MSNFYTHFHTYKNDILLRGYDKGKRVHRKVRYKPYIFLPSSNKSQYKTINGRSVEKLPFDSIWDAKQYIKRYEDVHNFEFFGATNFQYPFIYDTYGRDIKHDPNQIKVLFLDIETWSGKYPLNHRIKAKDSNDIEVEIELRNIKDVAYVYDEERQSWVSAKTSCYLLASPFPDIRNPNQEITAITLHVKGEYITLGYNDYKPKVKNASYIKCKNEKELLEKLLVLLRDLDVDAISGWNSVGFDVPYITNRIKKILGEDRVKKLSPWEIVEAKDVFVKGHEVHMVSWVGYAMLDYKDVYIKFKSATQESYNLDYIASVEIDAKKLDYSEHGTLHGLYLFDYERYMDYNVHDVTLLIDIEKKNHLFDIVFSIAYLTQSNYQDTFGTIKPWDTTLTNYLMDQGIVVPQTDFSITDSEQIAGGFVKEVQLGLLEWEVSFDVASLYPTLVRQLNISPDTIVGQVPNIDIERCYDKKLPEPLRAKIKQENYSMSAIGVLFKNNKQGFVAYYMEYVFTERKKWKKISNTKKSELNKVKEQIKATGSTTELESKKELLEVEYASANALQHALKILINSLYGALANKYFRWFDKRLAESITTTGQLANRWVIRDINLYLNKLLGTENIDFCSRADTDSCYLRLDKVVNKFFPDDDILTKVKKLDQFCEKKLQKVIKESCDNLVEYLNHQTNLVLYEREVISSKSFGTRKKRYAMAIYAMEDTFYSEPEFKITGLEAVKNSTPRAVRGLIKDGIKKILIEDEKSFQKFVDDTREEFKKKSFVDIAFTKSANNFDKYSDSKTIYKKGCPINVRAALVHNHLIDKLGLQNNIQKLNDGEKLKMCYLTMPNPANSNIIAAAEELPKEFGLDAYIDYYTQFDKCFLQPFQTIVESIEWTLEPIPSIEDLFEF